ncbi:hypothetical protein IGI37_001362 [Enterococcus sp. AZ194]|uniref:hypothetical protein n=1 Tax=Enterococcus sp. AZ194 TaxID=2774629 RepID=UPI003F291D0A
MHSRVINTMILSMFLIQQSYFPSIYTSINLLNKMAVSDVETEQNSDEKAENVQIPQHTARFSDGVSVYDDGDSLTIYQPNERANKSTVRQSKEQRRTFEDIRLDLMKLEEELYSKENDGNSSSVKGSVLGFQMSILSGIMIYGKRG